jgi:nucleotide-binding universal stress UspA family protein
MTITPTAPADRWNAASRPREDDSPFREVVVVGVDGSETALSAVRWAAREAETRGAPLRIVHAAPYVGEPGTPGGAPPALSRARQITSMAFTVARHTARDTPVLTEVVRNEPTAALLRAERSGQLLVLGISTTGAVDELVLAHLTQRVAARSTRPVAVVPRSRTEDTTGRPVVAVLGLGAAADDHAVAAFAAAAARRADGKLRILETRTGGTPDGDGWRERFPDIDVQHRSLHAASAVDLLGAAGPTPLLVFATGRASRFHRSLGGRSRWLLRHCTSPMVLVPSTGATADPQA